MIYTNELLCNGNMNTITDNGISKREGGQSSGRRWATFIGLSLMVAMGLGFALWYFLFFSEHRVSNRNDELRTPVTVVSVGIVEQGSIPLTLDAIGTVTSLATVTVRAQVSGVLRQILFNEGDRVSAGQILAIIDPSPFEMSLMQAKGQLQRDEAELANARLTLERYRKLSLLDSIAIQDVETQDALVRQLAGAVVVDRAAEGIARLNLSFTRILAPIAGRIGMRNVDVGNLVTPTDANGIAVITQEKPIDVVFSIPQDRILEIEESSHRSVGLKVAALDRIQRTVLDRGAFFALDNEVDVQTGTVRAKARFENERGALFPNQFVNIELLLRTIPDATLVATEAVRRGNDFDYAYVVDRETQIVHLRHIVLGVATAKVIQVLSGLQAGDIVATEGADRLKDGDRVRIRRGNSS